MHAGHEYGQITVQRRAVPVLMVCHDMKVVLDFARIVVMAHGSV